MGLDLRLMYVKPGAGSRVWDVKLLDQRQNARVFISQDGTEFIDVVIMGGEHYHPTNRAAQAVVAAKSPSRTHRKRLKTKRQKARKAH